MEPSFLLEGISRPDIFLPPKYEYQCTQMAIKQLERLNGGYRPAYAKKDPVLPQTRKLTNTSQISTSSIGNISKQTIGSNVENSPFSSATTNCVDSLLDLSDSFLNTGNVSILASTMNGMDVWGSGDSTGSDELLSVGNSIIQFKSAAENDTLEDVIPSSFLQMSSISLNDFDTIQPSFTSIQGFGASPSHTSFSDSICSGNLASHAAPKIIPISARHKDLGLDSLQVHDLSHINHDTSDTSALAARLLSLRKDPTTIQACCAPVLSKALRKKLPPEIAKNHLIMSSILGSSNSAVQEGSSNIMCLPPLARARRRQTHYCGYVRTIPANLITHDRDILFRPIRPEVLGQRMEELPVLPIHTKHYDTKRVIPQTLTLINKELKLPKIGR